MIANTPAPPYYAVIFSSPRTDGDHGYGEARRPHAGTGARATGFSGWNRPGRMAWGSLQVSDWRSEADILAWKVKQAEHRAEQGRATWYWRFRQGCARWNAYAFRGQ